MKINQDLVTKTFQCRNGTSGLYHNPGDVKVIQDVLQRNLGVFVSESEVIDFWHWRSNEWDGSFLSIMGGEKEILEWFPKFLQHVGVEIDEEEEPTMSEQTSVPVTQNDFILIRASLHHTISSFKHILETGVYPEGFNQEGVRELILMNSDLLGRIEMILTLKPIPSHNVGVTEL